MNKYRKDNFDFFLTPIEHLFDNHTFCDKPWCWARELVFKNEEMICKTRDKQV